MNLSHQRSAVSSQRTDARAPSLSEFFDEASTEPAPAWADYDFFGDSHFTTVLTR